MFSKKGTYYLDFPRELVFDYMKQPENAAVVAPSLSSSRATTQTINSRPVVEATYDIQGIIDGTVLLYPTEYEEKKHIRYEMRDEIQGYVDWYFYNEGHGTKFEYKTRVEFELPLPGFIINRIVSELAEKELDAIVDNLRTELRDFSSR